jgi:hypothetical protein
MARSIIPTPPRKRTVGLLWSLALAVSISLPPQQVVGCRRHRKPQHGPGDGTPAGML